MKVLTVQNTGFSVQQGKVQLLCLLCATVLTLHVCFQGEAGKPGKAGERGPAGPQVRINYFYCKLQHYATSQSQEDSDDLSIPFENLLCL